MDESRFGVLFASTYPRLARYARLRGLCRDDAEDLIAATFEVAWRRVGVVPEGDEALLWLYAVANNQLRNLRRRRKRDSELSTRLPPLDHVAPPTEPGDATIAAIKRAVDSLRDGDRELILLVAGDGLSPAEAGVVLGCGAVAARARLHRARKRLARFLVRDGGVQRAAASRHEVDEDYKAWEAFT
jgi:RNA polymerase sigma-70 factor (ECF subfamily)